MPRLFRAIVLALLLAPSLGVAQRLDSLVTGQRALDGSNLHIREKSNNPALVIPATSIPRLSSGVGTRGHFWAGAGIGLLGGALLGGLIGSTTEFCLDSCTPDEARSGAIKAGIILGAPAGFLLGGVIGALIRSDRPSSASFNAHRISVGPRLGAPGFTVDVRF